jgi:DNA-directed RNA polymerase specialized sigma24 family protein
MIDASVARHVYAVARHVAQGLNSPVFSRDDVAQSIFASLLERAPRFDARKASAKTFACLVVRHEAAAIISKALAQKRGDHRSKTSLDEVYAPGNPTGCGRAKIPSAEDYEVSWGRSARSSERTINMLIDVRSVVAQLPKELLPVARLLAQGETVADAAQTMGISRATGFRRVDRLRQILTDAGLRAYHGEPRRRSRG